MARTGKCPNQAGCLLASRNEIVTVQDEAAFVCTECKRPLFEAGYSSGRRPMAIPIIILGGIALLVIMGSGAVYFQVRHLKERHETGQIGTSFEQAEVAAAHGEFMPSRHMQAAMDLLGGVQAYASNLDLADPATQRVRADVLRRIGQMPATSTADTDDLRMSVQNARRMGRILRIALPAGHVAASPADVQQLRAALGAAGLQGLVKNGECVFLVLGFASPSGDEQASLRMSTQRAQHIADALRDNCGVKNAMHAVGMGAGYANETDAGRNGSVEVWALLP